METLPALLALCAGNSSVPGEFPTQRPVTRSFDVFFDLRLNKRLSKQPWGLWFETPSRPLWRHRNELWLWTELLYCWVVWCAWLISWLTRSIALCWGFMSMGGSGMMASSNGNIFRVTGHLCGDSFLFSLICGRINGWVNNGEAGDLRRHRAHFDVTVMCAVNLSIDTMPGTLAAKLLKHVFILWFIPELEIFP